MENLTGTVAVITGAGRGLGAALALVFADAGCDLVLCARRMADLNEIGRIIAGRTGQMPDLVALDLAEVGSVRDAVAQITSRRPSIDILVNNGATWLEGRSGPYEEAEVLGVMNAAVTGTFLFTQGLLPLLERSARPDVVTIGSITGLSNAALQTASVPFYAAKRGQVALAQGLRQSFSGSPVRSILVNPPYLDDARPDKPDWEQVGLRRKGQRGTSRDVVDAVFFAITRPRHITLTIDIDADDGGLMPS